ncbi:hypothetical protein D3C81_679270 [compost metagenome]
MSYFDRDNSGMHQVNSSIYSVFYGTDAILLEDELNETQWTSIERLASMAKNQYTNGLINNYTINTTAFNNIFYLDGIDSLSFIIDGYELTAGANTISSQPSGLTSADNRMIFQLSAAGTSARTDLVVLESWFETIKYNDVLRKFGGTETPTLQNTIYDNRISEETSRRVQFRWRIRSINGKSSMSGITALKPDGTDSGFVYSEIDGIYQANIGIQRNADSSYRSPGIVYCVPLFTVARPANSTTIVTGNITDIIPKSVIRNSNFQDSFINLNSNLKNAAPSSNGGINIVRGNSKSVSLRWNETSDDWEITTDGTNFYKLIHQQNMSSITPTFASLTITNDLNVGRNFAVTGTSTLTGDVTTTNNVTVGKNLTVNGTLKSVGAITSDSNVTVGGALSVALTTQLTGNVTTSNNVTVGKNLIVNGTTILNNSVSLTSGDVTLFRDPTDPMHAATKQYVDNIVQGLDIKVSVRAATTANITLSGVQTIDGVTLVAGDRVLVKNQTTGSQNGIYIVSSGAWVRSIDADTSAKVTSGMYTFVEEGTANGDNGYVLTTDDQIILGTTALTFIQFSGAGQITAGTYLSKSGNTLSHINSGITAGTYTKLTIDSQGHATSGTTLSASDIPSLDWTKITTGKPTTLANYGITDGVNISDVVTTAAASKILKLDANGLLPTGITGNSATTTKLITSRNIAISGDGTGTIPFDGSANVTIPLVLSNSGVTAGTYRSVTVDSKGRVTAGTNPTTLSGYGITDAMSLLGGTFTGDVVFNTNAQVNGNLYFKPIGDSTDTTYMVKESPVADNTFLSAYVGDNGSGAVLTGTSTSGPDYFAIKSTNLGIHHLFATNGNAVHAGTVTATSFLGSLVGNAATASKWNSAISLSLTGSVTGTVNIDGGGNVSLATITNHTHTGAQIDAPRSDHSKALQTASELRWIHYGNGHTILDNSSGTYPRQGNNVDAAIGWSTTYPVLMGYNGSSTYGVRVDSARVADNLNWNNTLQGNSSAVMAKYSSADGSNYTLITADAKVYRAVYNDLAELFLKSEETEPGDIVITENGKVKKVTSEYDTRVVGVHSDTYGMCLGGENKETPEDNFDLYTPIGISGRVLVKVTGDIEEGDLITSSSIPGVGVKANQYIPGTIVGKAMETVKEKDGICRIWALIMNV